MIKVGTPEDVQRIMSPIEDFSTYGALMCVGAISAKPVVWMHTYSPDKWLDFSGKLNLGLALSSSSKRATPKEWKAAAASGVADQQGRPLGRLRSDRRS